MTPALWDRLAAVFEEIGRDGALLDIVIPNASLKAWDKVLAMIRADYPAFVFGFEGDGRLLSRDATARDLFDPDYHEDETAIIRVPLADGFDANTHFFERELVEFDIDPRQVRSAATAQQLEIFMAKLHLASGKRVHLTLEGMEDAHIATCSRDVGGVRWYAADEPA